MSGLRARIQVIAVFLDEQGVGLETSEGIRYLGGLENVENAISLLQQAEVLPPYDDIEVGRRYYPTVPFHLDGGPLH